MSRPAAHPADPSRRNRILHLATGEKFIPPFVRLMRDGLPRHRHVFRIFKYDQPLTSWPEQRNVRVCRPRHPVDLIRLIRDLHLADRIILHGLFIKTLNLLLLLMPWLLGKCHWAIWGADLYCYLTPKPGREFVRRGIIPRIRGLVTSIPGEVRLARHWYRARGRQEPCFLYTSNTVEAGTEPLAPPAIGEPKVLLIGNSATVSNCHREVFDRLTALESADVTLVCPLSYGSRPYAEEIAAEGRRRFGGRFRPLMDFMPLDEYRKILAGVDIVVFGHDRQQAMGNTISLLAMGKTIYARTGLTSTRYLASLGFSLLPLDQVALRRLPAAAARRNQELARRLFSRDRLLAQWDRIFSGPP